MANLAGKRIGYAICGSFCTFKKTFEQIRRLTDLGAIVTPIMSFNAFSLNTRFGTAEENNKIIEELCGNKIIATIEDAEPIGPMKMFDIIVIAPCTGNTLAKLAVGIIDTPVTMAVKSHIRNARPVVIAVATNDALAGSAKNIGQLENYRNYYFVPMHQDDFKNKPTSVVSIFDLIPETVALALEGKQMEPMIM